jgi:hypothetical protein
MSTPEHTSRDLAPVGSQNGSGRNLVPRTAALTSALKRYSPIQDPARRRVATALRALQARPDRDTLQRVATALSGPIAAVFQSTSAGTVEIGDWLTSVKHSTPHGLFSALFASSPNALDAPIPMTAKQGQMFMRVASHPYVRDPKNWKHLPIGNVSTLDAMIRATGDPEDLAKLVASGHIHPKMSRDDAAKLRSPHWGAAPSLDPLVGVRRAVRTVLREHPTARPALRDYVVQLAAQLTTTETAEGRLNPLIDAPADDDAVVNEEA